MIYLDSNHRIASDKHQFILQRKIKRKNDNASWEGYKYFPTLKHLLAACLKYELLAEFQDEVVSLTEAFDRAVERIERQIKHP